MVDADKLKHDLLERGFYPAIVKCAIERAQTIDTDCTGCVWLNVRHQKCSCCRRNQHLKDNYKEARKE